MGHIFILIFSFLQLVRVIIVLPARLKRSILLSTTIHQLTLVVLVVLNKCIASDRVCLLVLNVFYMMLTLGRLGVKGHSSIWVALCYGV